MRNKCFRAGVLCTLVFGLTAMCATQSLAVVVGFGGITSNNVGDVAIGEAQLSADVTDAGAGNVLFTFLNAGPAASSITEVYFDDGSLLALVGLIDADDGVGGDPGVDFSPGAAPPDLPSGNNAVPPFVTTAGFLADADEPPPTNGVNPGESLGIVMSLQGGQTFADVESELGTGALRLGLHVTAFQSGGSESFVNTPPENGNGGIGEIPEPASIGIWSLLGLSWLAATWYRRRSRGADRVMGVDAPAVGGARQPWSPEARQAILAIIDRHER